MVHLAKVRAFGELCGAVGVTAASPVIPANERIGPSISSVSLRPSLRRHCRMYSAVSGSATVAVGDGSDADAVEDGVRFGRFRAESALRCHRAPAARAAAPPRNARLDTGLSILLCVIICCSSKRVLYVGFSTAALSDPHLSPGERRPSFQDAYPISLRSARNLLVEKVRSLSGIISSKGSRSDVSAENAVVGREKARYEGLPLRRR